MSAPPSPLPHLQGTLAQWFLVGFPRSVSEAIVAEVAARRSAAAARSLPGLEALSVALESQETRPTVICFGPELPTGALLTFLESPAAIPHLAVVLGAGSDAALFAPLVEQDRLFYLAARPPEVAAIVDLLRAAGGRLERRTAVELDSDVLRQIEEVERCRGLEDSLERVLRAALTLVPARRGLCLLVDNETSTLWRPSRDERGLARDSAISGVSSFVARTGRGVIVDQLGEDPRYDPDIDTFNRHERLLAVAVPGADPTARVEIEGVLSLTRGRGHDGFGADELARLQILADEVAPILRRRRLAFERARRERAIALFRREALDRRDQGLRTRQDPLRLTPEWIGTAYRVLVALFLAGVLLIALAGPEVLTTGPAIVRDWLRSFER